MKWLVRKLLLIVAMILICTNCALAATYPCDGQVLKNAVNVRKKASQGSDQVGKLKQNEVIMVIGEETNGNTVWYQIEFGKGKTGYVRGDLIRLNNQAEKVSKQNENNTSKEDISVNTNKTSTSTKNKVVTQSIFEKSNPNYPLTYKYDRQPFVALSYKGRVYAPHSRELKFYKDTNNAELKVGYLNTSGDTNLPDKLQNTVTEFISAYLKAAGYSYANLPVEINWYWVMTQDRGVTVTINGYSFVITNKKEGGYYEVYNGITYKGMRLDELRVRASKINAEQYRYQTQTNSSLCTLPISTTGENEVLVLPSYDGTKAIDELEVYNNTLLNYDTRVKSIVMGSQMKGIDDTWYIQKIYPNLENFIVSDNHPYLATIDGCLYNKEKKTLIACPPQKKELVIPEGILGIESSACANSRLESVNIPSSCISIEHNAFDNCKDLKQVVFASGSSLEQIGNRSFRECLSLVSIHLASKNNVNIEEEAFVNCTALESINMTDTACALIGEKAFEGSTNLSKVLFPDKLISIGANAFSGCPVRTVDLSEGLESIGSKAFDALEKAKLPVSLQSFEYNSFNPSCQLTVAEGNEMYYENEGGVFRQDHVLVYYPYEAKKDVTAYEISEGTTAVICPMGSYIKRLIVPSTVTSFKNFSTTATLIVDSGSYAESFAIKNKYNYETRIVEGNDLSWLSATPVPSPTPVPTPTYTMSHVSEEKQLSPSSSTLQIASPVVTSGFSNANVGDYITFGSYEQDGNESNGKEPIEWVVLAKENNRLLVTSRYALDCQPYNENVEEVTWETCSLRTWLNMSFYNSAFNGEEQDLIDWSTVTVDQNPKYSTIAETTTQDKVFLLNVVEANEYFVSDEMRQCQGTVYARKQGAAYDTDRECYWWLRTIDDIQTVAMDVDPDGIIEDVGFDVYNSCVAVRPALWIDLGS